VTGLLRRRDVSGGEFRARAELGFPAALAARFGAVACERRQRRVAAWLIKTRARSILGKKSGLHGIGSRRLRSGSTGSVRVEHGKEEADPDMRAPHGRDREGGREERRRLWLHEAELGRLATWPMTEEELIRPGKTEGIAGRISWAPRPKERRKEHWATSREGRHRPAYALRAKMGKRGERKREPFSFYLHMLSIGFSNSI
jgi:hypothetical protein